jgi:mRNA-degrading endonuclease RelE of RelBE toxin-antitoxin system
VKRVLFRPAAVKDLEDLQARDRDLVEAAIERFARTGQGSVKMLAGTERHLRLRAGDWRIRFVYEHPDAIRILHIRNRREAYR